MLLKVCLYCGNPNPPMRDFSQIDQRANSEHGNFPDDCGLVRISKCPIMFSKYPFQTALSFGPIVSLINSAQSNKESIYLY